MHHYIGSLVPNCDEAPAFAQIYIHDGTAEAEVENRQRHLGEAKLPELKALQQMLHEVNLYASHFKQAADLMRAQGGVDIRMIIRADGCPDPRRYNAPSAPEIAVLPSSQLTMTPLPEAIAPAKRESVPNISDGKG